MTKSRDFHLPVGLQARFWAKVVQEGECWVWTALTAGNGYGRIQVGGTTKAAHRVAYESLRSEIPPGLELDHLCRNRACVNPDHLEPVTHAENMRRTASPTCSRGHKRSPGEPCKKCQRIRFEKHYKENRDDYIRRAAEHRRKRNHSHD